MKTYGLTIFIAAFLLFLVQPMLAKFILPWFGGSPAVWTTCMLFFQAFLLAGYAYAHASTRRLSPRKQASLHLLLVAIALIFLPIIPGAQWKPDTANDPVWSILLLLTATVGLPYLILAATSPLLQWWFSRTHPTKSPYRLYAVSNAGSLLALASYPFIFEPLTSKQTQAYLWAGGLVLYGVLMIVCTVRLWRTKDAGPTNIDRAPKESRQRPFPSIALQVIWLALAACASVILLGTTNSLCRNVAVVPFLWVLPLGLYLLTFIICFDRAKWYHRPTFTLLLIPTVALLCHAASGLNGPLYWQITLYCGGLFISCMVCHGELYRSRPDPRNLTLFYLIIAAGGALGGVFAAIIAPRIFLSFAELNWGLCLLGILLVTIHFRDRIRWRTSKGPFPTWPAIAVGTIVLAAAFLRQNHRNNTDTVAMSRSFFGTLRVKEVFKSDPSRHGYYLQHGTILHGAQFIDPKEALIPLTYYNRESGIGLAMAQLSRQSGRRIGIVGLGVGTLAAYGMTGDTFRFYEIDPDVHRIADEWFTYLRDSKAHVEVILGDARLSMESEPDQKFDLLVLDAFSGDAPPVHLLTLEAFDTYLRHLAPDGVIALNVSNKYANYYPIMLGVIRHHKMAMGLIPMDKDFVPYSMPSRWILITRSRAFLSAQPIINASRRPSDPKSRIPIVWTDDYASLFQILE